MKTYIISDEKSRGNAMLQLQALSLEPVHVVEIKKHVKQRNHEQNSLQWAGMLADYSMQVVVDGRQYTAKVWHEHLKELHLPEQYEEGITLKNYVKWQEMPDGKLRLIGSTKQLTTKGFSEYMERCHAYGAQELEIRFTASPNQQNH